VDEDFLEYCEEGALSIEAFGHKERGTLTLREALDQVGSGPDILLGSGSNLDFTDWIRSLRDPIL
jgi:hypothetical protein